MTDAEKLMNAYDRAQTRLHVAILHPAASKYSVRAAIKMLNKARAKVLKAMEGEGATDGHR